MILTGQLMLCEADASVSLQPGWLEIERGIITRIETDVIRKDADYGDVHTLICPGFTDCHAHLPQFNAIGAHGMTLLDWLESVVYPAESRWGDTRYAQVHSEAALRSMIGHGTLGCAAYATVHHAGTDAALQNAHKLGMRAVIGQVLMDIQATAALRRPVDQLTHECHALLEDWKRYNRKGEMQRVCAAVNPRFALCCSTELLDHAGKLAAEHQAIVQTHLAEMPAESAIACELHAAESYTSIYERSGLLGTSTLLAHGIWLDSPACETIATHGATVVHCPLANNFLRSGTMNRDLWLCRGIQVALGSDIGAGYSISMVRNAQAMLNAAFYTQTPAASPAQAWWQITRGNAQAIGWQDAGELRQGVSADLLCIEPDNGWQDTPNPLGYLLFAWDDRWLKRVFLQGKPFLG